MLKIYAAEYVYVYVCDQAQESKESFREHPQRFESRKNAWKSESARQGLCY